MSSTPRIDFTEHRLDNGLRAVLSEDHLAPVVAVNLWYDVGSRHEAPGRTGLAHLFEHMMFQGSRSVAKAEHFALVTAAGGTLNASTWVDRTNYFETVPSHQLELALWLEADRMGGLLDALGQETLDNQREVVKNEKRWRVDNRPYGTWDQKLQAAIFPEGHHYHHPTIGSMEDLDATSLEDVQDFFRTYYAPNNAVLSVVGDFEPSAALRWAEKHFGPIPANPNVPAGPSFPLPPRLGTEFREVIEDRVPLRRVYVAYRVPPAGSREFPALAMTSAVLVEGKTSRLYRRLVRERLLAQDVQLGPFEWAAGTSMMIGWATARPEVGIEELEAAFHEVLDELAEEGPTGEELVRARATAEREELEELSKVSERADRLSMHATLFGDPGRVNERLPSLLAVTAEDIQKIAGDYLRPDNRAVLVYQPAA
ncbi:MAG TPA: pitrilysin family protein [Actinomycetota bacterium]